MSQSIQTRRFFKRLKPKQEVIVLKPKSTQFPSISLTIPEGFWQATVLHPIFLTAFTSGFLFVSIAIVGFDVRSNLATFQTVRSERANIDSEINYWKGVVNKYQGYRDGYYQLALLEYRAGYKQDAYTHAKLAYEIDSSLIGAKELMERLTIK